MVRDIIDIDSTYEDFENDSAEDDELKKVGKQKEDGKKEEDKDKGHGLRGSF